MSEERCKADVPNGGRSVTFHQCYNKAKKDGYCSIHHPDSVKERAKKSQERWEEQCANNPLRKAHQRIQELEQQKAELYGALEEFMEKLSGTIPDYYRDRLEAALSRARGEE